MDCYAVQARYHPPMLRQAPLIAALSNLLGGCLCIPPAPATDAGGDDDVDAPWDAPVIDATPNPCGDRAQFTAMPFPPGGEIEVGVRQTFARDVNVDGFVDMVIASGNLTDENDWGVYVLLGPQSDPENLQYHAFLATDVAPWGVAVDRLTGNDCLDVAVFGENRPATAGMLEIYPNQGPPAMFPADPPLTKDMGFVPGGPDLPVSLVFGDFDGVGGPRDLAVADLYELRVVEVGDSLEDNLLTAEARRVAPDGSTVGGWSSINGIYARPRSTSGAHDLVVVEIQFLTWMENDGTGVFTQGPQGVSDGLFGSMAVIEHDLDGQAPVDFFGGSGTNFGVHEVEVTSGEVTVTTRAWPGTLPVYNALDHFNVVDLGGGPQPEVVVLERDQAMTQPAYAVMIENLYDDGNQLQPLTVSPALEFPTGVHPWQSLVIDFDDDGASEVWAIAADGQMRCIRRKATGAELEFCP